MTHQENEPSPVVEPAPLPREMVGPFLILGVAKDTDVESIEAAWARRVMGARQGKTRTPLEDIHWARTVLRDPEQRLPADVRSLNIDLNDAPLQRLESAWSLDTGKPRWPPIEPNFTTPDVEVPDPDVICHSITPPDVPIDLPGVDHWLEKYAMESIDPWSVNLPCETPAK